MKRTAIILLITIISLSGCTRLPVSQETGVRPGEYEGLESTEILEAENTNLKNELDKAKNELEELKKEYFSLAKNNNSLTEKLIGSDALLNILQNDKLPVFNIENSDIISITKYLNEKRNILNNNYREIEIVPSETNNKIIFCTKGYGNNFSQLYIWEAGLSEPSIVDGANFDRDGSCNWLIKDKYLIIETGYDDKYLIVDTIEKEIISTFDTESDIYLIPETSSILMQKTSLGSTAFVLYDFLTDSEQELGIDFKTKYTSFKISEDNIVFEGNYTDEYGTQYTLNAVISLDKILDSYDMQKFENVADDDTQIENEESQEEITDDENNKTNGDTM